MTALVVGLVAVAVSLTISVSLAPWLGGRLSHALFLVAVAAAAWWGGLAAAAVAGVGGAVVAHWLSSQRGVAPPAAPNADMLATALFLLMAAFTTYVIEYLHRARRDAAKTTEELRRRQRALEESLAERQRIADELARSESEFRATFMVATFGKVQADVVSGRIVRVNPRFCDLLGYTAEELQARTYLDISHPDDRAASEAAFARLVSGVDRYYRMEKRYVRSDGRIIWVRVEAGLVRDGAGRPMLTTAEVYDVTAERQANAERDRLLIEAQRARQELEASVRLLHRVQAVVDVALENRPLDELLQELLSLLKRALDADVVTVLLVDDGALRARAALGLSADEMRRISVPLGEGFAGRIAAAAQPMVWEDVDYTRIDSPVFRDYGIRAVAGVPLTFDERLVGVVHAGSRRPSHFGSDELHVMRLASRRLAIAIDRAQVADAEREARAEAERANRTKDEFLALVSHELRSPLTAMAGWLSVLERAEGDPTLRQRAIETLSRNLRLQTDLIEELLDVSRIVAGKLELERAELELDTLVRACVESVRPQAAAKSLELMFAGADEALPVVGDERRLAQVVNNLLSNAVRYTEPGGRIVVTSRHEGDSATIRVQDTGAGIAPEFLPHVFERFRQADTEATRSGGGLGIGLSIAKAVVDRHAGRIVAESAGPGRGTTFTVSLPLATPRARPPLRGLRALGDGGVPRILLVEGDADTREALRLVLEGRGARVTGVATMREALDALDRDDPNVVVTAVAATRDEADDLIRCLREREATHGRRVPAIALGSALPADHERSLRDGFDRHLGKPTDPDELAAVVHDLCMRDVEPVAQR